MSLALIPPVLWMARRAAPWPVVARQTAAALAVAIAVIGPWWWFMIRTYGDPMAFGAIAATQPDLTRQDATFLQLLFSGRFVIDRWVESWGEFGWRLIHIGGGLTAALFVGFVLCAAGLLLAALGQPERSPDRRWRIQALAILGAACALSYFATAQFGVRFVLTQARYFFPMVDAAALLLMLGLRAWIPATWRDAGQAVVVFLAIAVNVTIYTGYVIPYWYFR
jgi:hypothetical protein